MQETMPSTRYCVFSELENGIWEFRFLKSNNQAVDEWVEWQNYLKNRPPKAGENSVRTLLDFRPDGPVSMMYALQKNFDWRKQNQDVGSVPVKVAIVLMPMNRFINGYASLIKEGINVFGMRKVQVELFQDTYQLAVDWLLED